MIDEGTGPEPANFAQFEPVLGAGRPHRGAALRVPAVPGRPVCRRHADGRRSRRRAAAARRTGLPASVRRRLTRRCTPAHVRADPPTRAALLETGRRASRRPGALRSAHPRRALLSRACSRRARSGLGESYMDGWWDVDVAGRHDARACCARGSTSACPGSASRAGRPARAAAQPADRASRVRGRQAPLRHRQRPVPAHARPAHGLQLRLLARRATTWTPRRKPSSTWSAASSACARACACSTSAAAGARR